MGHGQTGATATHHRLRLHRNFRFPPDEQLLTDEAIVTYAIEAAANFISPSKAVGEDEEFACEDVADALRRLLLPELLGRVRALRAVGNATPIVISGKVFAGLSRQDQLRFLAGNLSTTQQGTGKVGKT